MIPTNLPIDFHFDEDGKLHVEIGADVVIHYKGQKTEIVEEESLQITRSNGAIITGGELHLNPQGEWAKHIMESMLGSSLPSVKPEEIIGNEVDTPEAKKLKSKIEYQRKQKIRKLKYKRKKGCKCG